MEIVHRDKYEPDLVQSAIDECEAAQGYAEYSRHGAIRD
jgi:hypothetical protein